MSLSAGLADGVTTVDPVRHRINKLGHRHLVPSCDVSIEYSFKSSKSNMFVASNARNRVLADEPDKRRRSGTGHLFSICAWKHAARTRQLARMLFHI